LGSNVADLSCDGRLRRVGARRCRWAARTRSSASGRCSIIPASYRSCWGSDALELLMAASGRPAAILDARAAALPDCRDDLALAAALESRE